MVRIELMADRIFRLDRRDVLAGLGAAALGPGDARAFAAADSAPALRAAGQGRRLGLRPGQPDTPVWSLGARRRIRGLRFRRGETLEIGFQNDLPVPAVLELARHRRRAAAEPLAGAAAAAAGRQETL